MSATAANLVVSAYRFVALDDLTALRQRLFDSGHAVGLKGTVRLAEEGISIALSGPAAPLNAWLDELQADPHFAALPLKFSSSDAPTFQRLKVKVKREIIRIDQPAIAPASGRAPAVSPTTLARWLEQGSDDAGRPLRLLDTRNAFEVDAGAFAGAIDWRLAKFSDFPAALAAHRAELDGATVVSYCTGGIRCEKAVLVMQALGLTHSHQLDGGILNYFIATDGAAPGWQGNCVVFDDRGAVNRSLEPAP